MAAKRDPTAADRQKRRRVREALGVRSFRVELPEDRVVAAMIAMDLIAEAEALDHQMVERALEIFLRNKILRHA